MCYQWKTILNQFLNPMWMRRGYQAQSDRLLDFLPAVYIPANLKLYEFDAVQAFAVLLIRHLASRSWQQVSGPQGCTMVNQGQDIVTKVFSTLCN